MSILKTKQNAGDCPGGPAAKTPCFQRRGVGFKPWSGDWILHATTKTWNSQINKYFKNNLEKK